jgi:PTH1 family peptidyl-tRNA hydrolase
MKLIVGLGNPGAKYAHHRHNVGYMAVERIADRHGFSAWKKRFQGTTSEGTLDGEKVLLLKPDTYMNESGRAVGEALRFLKIGIEDLIVIFDEIDLAPGKLKVKAGGGNAGHNGLRSISAHCDNDYVRVRIGVGHPGHKDLVAGYVLHDFAKADQDWLDPLLDAMAKAAGRLAAGDAARFMTDVALTLQGEAGRDGAAKARGGRQDSGSVSSESQAAPQPDYLPARNAVGERAPRTDGAKKRHPAGERAAKQQSALAENLRRWMAGKKKT